MRGTSFVNYKRATLALSGELEQFRVARRAFRENPDHFGAPILQGAGEAPPTVIYAEAGNGSLKQQVLFADRDVMTAKIERRGASLGALASIFGHASLLSVILLSATAQIPKSQLIAVAIEALPQEEPPHQLAPAVAEPESVAGLESAHKRTEPARATSLRGASEVVSANSVEGSAPEVPTSRSAQSPGVSEVYLSKATATSADSGGGIIDFVEQGTQQSSNLTANHKTDWQTSPVEDNTLTYSAGGSGMRLTVREASSAGFVSSGFAPSFGPTNGETADTFDLATAWDDNAKAKSEKADWTLVDQKNFGLTAFGYRNEVGYDFHSFGQNKNEFTTPGTSTMQFGAETRLGDFALGLAHSNISKLDNIAPAYSSGSYDAGATLDEASLKINLPHLLASESGFAVKLIPTVWISAGERQSADPQQVGTSSTSFGGSWSWDHGYTSLGYWNYSSDGDASRATGWSGQGFDGNLGIQYGAIGVDVSVSYGRSAGTSPMWESAGALYNSTMTVSYTPKKLPGIWASATAGNYDHDGLAYGSPSSEIYGTSTKDEYWSMAAGLDLTSWFWSPELTSGEAQRSVKLLYRYTDSLTLDSAAGKTTDNSNLVAVMLQRKF